MTTLNQFTHNQQANVADFGDYARGGNLATPLGKWIVDPEDQTMTRLALQDNAIDSHGRRCFTLANNSLLPSDWVRTVIGKTITVFEQAPTIYNDMVAAGLSDNIPITERIAVMINYHMEEEPRIDMEGDDPFVELGTYNEQTLPMKIMHKASGRNFRDYSWQVRNREMEMQRLMWQRLEKLFLFGHGGAYSDTHGGSTELKGLTNADGVNTISTFNIGQVGGMDGALVTEFHRFVKPLRDIDLGNIHVYLPVEAKNTMMSDYKQYSGRTNMQRIMDEVDIRSIKFCKELDGSDLGNAHALAISFEQQCVGVLQSIPYTMMPIPASNQGTSIAFKHLFSAVPYVRKDANGKTGVVYAS